MYTYDEWREFEIFVLDDLLAQRRTVIHDYQKLRNVDDLIELQQSLTLLCRQQYIRQKLH